MEQPTTFGNVISEEFAVTWEILGRIRIRRGVVPESSLKKILSMMLRQILINVRRGRDLGGGNICQLEKLINFPGGERYV